MHLHYKSLIGAKKALSKNGKVIGNNIMVGVRQCIDKAVMSGKADLDYKSSPNDSITLHSVNHTIPTKTLGSVDGPSGGAGKAGTPLRPLTQVYQTSATNKVCAFDFSLWIYLVSKLLPEGLYQSSIATFTFCQKDMCSETKISILILICE